MLSSAANLFFELGDFVSKVDDHLLHHGLLLLELDQLLLHMFVFLLLFDDRVRQLLKVGHYKRVHYFDVLVVLCGQVVLHQGNLLS